jgi:hypothetical protein
LERGGRRKIHRGEGKRREEKDTEGKERGGRIRYRGEGKMRKEKHSEGLERGGRRKIQRGRKEEEGERH